MGSRVGPYIVTSTLGQGTFGKVKLATHQETGLECALRARRARRRGVRARVLAFAAGR